MFGSRLHGVAASLMIFMIALRPASALAEEQPASEPFLAAPAPDVAVPAGPSANSAPVFLHPDEQFSPGLEQTPFVLGRIRVGRSYFDLLPQGPDGTVRSGLTYGADFVRGLTGKWFAYGGVSANHFSQGSQVLGTLGVFAMPSVCSPGERFGYSVLYDQFTDTRLSGLYLSQVRLSLDYAITRSTTLSLQFTEPVLDDQVDLQVLPVAAALAPIQVTRGVELILSQKLGPVLASGGIGYRDLLNSTSYRANLTVPIRQRTQMFLNILYLDRGIWANTMGLQFSFGGPRRHRCAANGDCTRGQMSETGAETDLWLQTHSLLSPDLWSTTATNVPEIGLQK